MSCALSPSDNDLKLNVNLVTQPSVYPDNDSALWTIITLEDRGCCDRHSVGTEKALKPHRRVNTSVPAKFQGRPRVEDKDRRDCRVNEFITLSKKLCVCPHAVNICLEDSWPQHFVLFLFWQKCHSLKVEINLCSSTWPSRCVSVIPDGRIKGINNLFKSAAFDLNLQQFWLITA